MTIDEVRDFLIEHFEMQDDKDDIVGQYLATTVNRENFAMMNVEDVAMDFEEWAS